jgi:predicted phosphodiesterase
VPQATGIPAHELPDETEVWERARREWKHVEQLTERRNSQAIKFEYGPVAFALLADQHFGDPGVDYPRAQDEAQLVAETPGLYAILAGDVVNNFILAKLSQARFDTRLSIPDEWALLRGYLRILAPKLQIVVGNHDQWVTRLAGIDYFRDVVAEFRPTVIYDSDDCLVNITVGSWVLPTRIRHKWRGSSIYNPTHGIERAAKWDQDFIIGMGAHTHVSGVVRSFNIGGANGMALMAGTYKRVDQYARRLGFAKSNTSTAVAVLIDEKERALVGFDNLKMVAKYLCAVYK